MVTANTYCRKLQLQKLYSFAGVSIKHIMAFSGILLAATSCQMAARLGVSPAMKKVEKKPAPLQSHYCRCIQEQQRGVVPSSKGNVTTVC